MGNKERRGGKEKKRVTHDYPRVSSDELAEAPVHALVILREQRVERLPEGGQLRLLDGEALEDAGIEEESD